MHSTAQSNAATASTESQSGWSRRRIAEGLSHDSQVLPVQAQHDAALAEVQQGAAAALEREQRTVAAREQEIADLTLALAERTAEVRRGAAWGPSR